MSEPGEPDARDWFRGGRVPEGAPTPRPVAEAFGHLRKPEAGSGGDSGSEPAADSGWFAAQHGSAEAPPEVSSEVPAEASEVSEPETALEPAAAPAAEAASDSASEPAPDDGRVRLRALTGGLADLSDALAAIGIESVALRSAPAAGSAAPTPAAPAPAADFRVRCPDCGPQYVAIADVRFVETGDGADSNRYLFTCPACRARVRRPAGPELAEILKSSGVATLALRRGPGQAL